MSEVSGMSTSNPVNLLDFDVDGLVAWFAGLGEKPLVFVYIYVFFSGIIIITTS